MDVVTPTESKKQEEKPTKEQQRSGLSKETINKLNQPMRDEQFSELKSKFTNLTSLSRDISHPRTSRKVETRENSTKVLEEEQEQRQEMDSQEQTEAKERRRREVQTNTDSF